MSPYSWVAAISVWLFALALIGSHLADLVTARYERSCQRWHNAPGPPEPQLPPLPRRLTFPPEPVHLSQEEHDTFWQMAWQSAMHRSEGEWI